MTFELGRSLVLADAIAPDALAHALLVVATTGVCLPRALVAVGAMEVTRLDEHLARGDAPMLRHVVPVPELVAKLPAGICEQLLALPVRQDPRTETVDVAVVDARDSHAGDEIAFWLEAPVRLVRTSFVAMDAALKRLRVVPDRGVRSLAAPIWVPATSAIRKIAETPLYGTRAVQPPADAEADEDALYRTEIGDFPAVDPNIPIPLSRRSMRPVSIVEVDGASVAISLGSSEVRIHEPGLPEPDAVIDLRRRRASTPPIAAEPMPVSRTPITTRGPFSANAPTLPFADIGTIIAAMRAAPDRDRVLDLLLAGARTVARRVAIFVVKKDELIGWTCTPELGERAALRRVQIPTTSPSLLTRALDGGTHIGRLQKIDEHTALFDAMHGVPTREVAVTGVRIEARPTIVVLSDEVGDTLIATRRLDEIAHVAGEALGAIIRNKTR